MASNQSNGISELKRIELTYKDKTYEFSINPQELSVSLKNRVNPTQTLGGFWIDKFGSGLHELSLSGITGFKVLVDADEGHRKFKELKEIIETVYSSENNLRTQELQEPMEFLNFTDDEYYKIIPTDFTVQRSVSNPLVFRYSLKAFIIEDMLNPSRPTDLLNKGGLMDGIIGDVLDSKKSLLDSIKNKFDEIKQEIGFSNWLKDKPLFNKVINTVTQNLDIDIDLKSGTVRANGGLSLGGASIPFSFDSKNGSSIAVNIADTGTLLDGLHMSVGTDSNGKLSPLAFNYSMGAMNLEGSVKLNRSKSHNEQVSYPESFSYKLCPKAEELKNNFNESKYDDFNFDSYLVGSKTSENFSSILSINYGKYDSLLQRDIQLIERKLTQEEKNCMTSLLLNSLATSKDIQDAMTGSIMTTTQEILTTQITNIEVMLNNFRSKENPEYNSIISTLEDMKSIYKGFLKIELTGGGR